jgi:dihydroflavonol-4-reductase
MRVLVTGANGHLGFTLVEQLRDAGHQVRAGVRHLSDPARTARLKTLRSVETVLADLDQPSSLRHAMTGVEVLLHAAAVYSLCDPARTGETLRASTTGLEAAMRAAAEAGVRKVVLTSSVLTVPLTRPDAPPSTEGDWTQDTRVPYVRAKTEGERLAWALAAELGLKLVTILPGSIGGPGFARNTPTIDLIETMMKGGFRAGVPSFNLPYVDVRDVARAHRLAAEADDVAGRFIVVNDELPRFRDLLLTMGTLDARVKPPLATLPDWMLPAVPVFDCLNARTLGTPRTASRQMIGMMRSRCYNASNRRAREVLGWRPQVSLARSLKDTMNALRRRSGEPELQ